MQEIETQETLPYGSAGTFITTLDHLGAVGTPNILDRNALPPSFSGSSRYETLSTLKFFKLIDKDGRPDVPMLTRLISPETRKDAILELLQRYYAGLFSLPLSSAGPTEIQRWFADNATPSTAGKARAFFIALAKQNGVAMHSMVAKGTRVVGGGIKRKRRKPKPNGNGVQFVQDTEVGDDSGDDTFIERESIADKLLSKFPTFDPSWSPEVQEKWFEAFGKLQDNLK